MTLTTTETRVVHLGDGGATHFPVPFPFFGPDELLVTERQLASGVETPRTLGQHYAVMGGEGEAGSVMALIAPPAGVAWHIRRRTRRTQETDYVANDAFAAETHERALDRLQAQLQELDVEFARTLRLPETGAGGGLMLPQPVPLGFLRVASDGMTLQWQTLAEVGTLVVSPFIQTLLDDVSAAQARATLGLTGGSGTVTSVNVQPAAGGTAGLAFSGGPVVGSGTISGSLAFAALPIDAAPNPAEDYLATFDVSAGQHRRIRIDQLPAAGLPDGAVTTQKLANAAVTAAKLASGAAVQGASNLGSVAGGEVFADRSADTLRFRRIVVQRAVVGSGNAVSDVNIAVANASDRITITLTVTKVTITGGGGGGGGGE